VTKIRILLVDDFKPWRIAAKRILSALSDCQIVGEASDGVEGIEKAGSLLPDVVLLDVGMPRLDGLEAARRIAQVSPKSKIVFLTEQNDDEVRSAALATGAAEYVLKSRAASELQLRLEGLARMAGETSASFLRPAATFPSQ
jgi:DNA-binding NarL/FixJ family response regulator